MAVSSNARKASFRGSEGYQEAELGETISSSETQSVTPWKKRLSPEVVIRTGLAPELSLILLATGILLAVICAGTLHTTLPPLPTLSCSVYSPTIHIYNVLWYSLVSMVVYHL
jgi:hypothetical protein